MDIIDVLNTLGTEINYEGQAEFFMIFAGDSHSEKLDEQEADMCEDIMGAFKFTTYRTFASAFEVLNFAERIWENRESCRSLFSVVIVHWLDGDPWDIELTATALTPPPNWVEDYRKERAKIVESFSQNTLILEAGIELG